MRTDNDIRKDVEAELHWEPEFDETDVAISVRDGVVTLTGFVRSYGERFAAERAAKRVTGVFGLANDIEVRLLGADDRTDPEIAREVTTVLRTELPYSFERIKAIMKQGWLTLEGQVEWNYQREQAAKAAQRVRGIKGVSNAILLKPKVEATEVKHKIEEAFRRSAEIDASHVIVEVNGSEVILRGKVSSWAERQEAERTVWAAPGVIKVDNRITIQV